MVGCLLEIAFAKQVPALDLAQMKTTLACLLLGLPFPLSAADKKGDALYFPPARGEWEKVEPATIGWDAAKLKQALAYAGKQQSSGVVILYRGRILAEQYWKLNPPERTPSGGRNPYFHFLLGVDGQGHSIENVASAQKSVAAMLVGIAQQKGLLKIDDPVSTHLGKGWSQAPAEAEAKITIRHLVSMSSGLGTRLQYVAPAGTKWFYNTTAYSRSLTCVARASGMDENQLTKNGLPVHWG